MQSVECGIRLKMNDRRLGAGKRTEDIAWRER
jgi:hypothetical protein